MLGAFFDELGEVPHCPSHPQAEEAFSNLAVSVSWLESRCDMLFDRATGRQLNSRGEGDHWDQFEELENQEPQLFEELTDLVNNAIDRIQSRPLQVNGPDFARQLIELLSKSTDLKDRVSPHLDGNLGWGQLFGMLIPYVLSERKIERWDRTFEKGKGKYDDKVYIRA